MDFFNSKFYLDSLAINAKLRQLQVVKTSFPEINYIVDNDVFFKQLWKTIDEAKHYVWLMTYTFDNSVSATYTLKKLIEAQKRGVKVCLLIDNLNDLANPELKKELYNEGGMVHTLNKILPYWTGLKFSNEMFRRHHEKVVIADETTLIGSANISDDYTGPIYGGYDFVDLNLIMRNVCLSQIREFFGKITQFYGFNLDRHLTNEEIIQKYDQQFPNSAFGFPKVRLIRTHSPHIEEIQDFLLQKINEAKESIKIIQPYYYPVRKFDKALVQALKRGVSVEIVTAGKRDTPAYAPLKNMLMMNTLIMNGLKVYEIKDKLLHMKVYQFDDKLYTTGSFNNDWMSWDVNNEMNIIVEDPVEVEKINKIYDDVKAKATPLDPDMGIGISRYVKLKFWETFIMVSEWVMNRKRSYKAEKKFREYKEFKSTLKEKDDAEAVDALKKLKESKYKKMFMDWDDGLGSKF